MSQDIKPGDLVMVVKPAMCCGDTSELGLVFCVDEIDEIQYTGCTACGAYSWTVDAYSASNELYLPIGQLKKLPPLSEDEHTETHQKIKEPA